MGYCTKCGGGIKLLLGVVVLIYNWTLTGEFIQHDWATFIGIALVVVGFMMVVKPSCGCCGPCRSEKAIPKKKRRK